MFGQASSNVSGNTSSNEASKPPTVVEDAIAAARKAIRDLLDREPNLRPHCIRIAFYDAISFDPIGKVDGPNGSIRLWEGLAQDEEMKRAIAKLDTLKAGNPNVWLYVSYADLYQLAGIEVVRKAGGPSIEFQYGRLDSCVPVHSSKLPIQAIDEDTNAALLRETFHRIGFTDKEIVALSSAHYYWMNYTPHFRLEQPNINTSYYEKLVKEFEITKSEASNIFNRSSVTTQKQPRRSTITTTPTIRYWKCLLSDVSFRKHVELFAKDATLFEKEYASAHKKLSELGFKYFPNPNVTDIKHGFGFAVAMAILFAFFGFFYKAMKA